MTRSILSPEHPNPFYAMFRSGLNLRFRDASLTVPQIVAANMVILYALFNSKDGKGILALIYGVSFLFGVFRLSTRELLALTAFVSVSYALIIGLNWYPEAGSVPVAFKRMMLNWFVLTAVLTFCSVLGGYVSKLRKNLTERRVLLWWRGISRHPRTDASRKPHGRC